MEEQLIEKEKERNKTMPTLTDIPLEDKINIDQIRKLRATQILYQPVDNEELSLEKLPEDTKNYDISIKIILLGDSNVGKTSIVHCLNNETYNNYQRKSLGLEHYNYVIKINNVIIRMQIWDTVGQEKFDSLTTNYYKNTGVAIFVYSITDLNSFNKIEQMDKILNDKGNINDVDNNNENNNINNNDNVNPEGDNKKEIIKVLLGNKKDLENERKISLEQGEKLSKEKNFAFFQEICCNLEFDENEEKNNIEEIINLFNDIGKKLYKDYILNDRGRLNSSSYCYQPSPSILIGNESVRSTRKSGSCCC